MQKGTLTLCCATRYESDKVTHENSEDAYAAMMSDLDFFLFIKCDECLSDTFSYPSRHMLSELEKLDYWKNYLSDVGYDKYSNNFIPYRTKFRKNIKHTVLMVGKWGQEDIWQQAELRTYVSKRQNEMPGIEFIVCSTFPFITERTLAGFTNVQIVPVYDRDFLARIPVADELVVFSDDVGFSWIKWAVKLAGNNGIPIDYVDDLFVDAKKSIDAMIFEAHCPPLKAVSCWIDVESIMFCRVLQKVKALSETLSLPCRFYSMNNFCQSPNGDNRDKYFEFVPQVFGDGWEIEHWIDNYLACIDKSVVAMKGSEYVVAVGKSSIQLAKAVGVVPHNLEVKNA